MGRSLDAPAHQCCQERRAIRGTIDANNQCFSDGCTALVNFWRSISNLTINVAGKSGCRVGEFWATSQATSLRRVNVNGNATHMDYCSGPSYASGGFIADSKFGWITVDHQQQYFVRNSSVGGWRNAVWNQVFAGVTGAPAQSFPTPPYTTLATNPESREKPFLYVDSKDHYNVFVPDVQFNSSGTTWSCGQTPGHTIPIQDYFIAKPADSVQTINNNQGVDIYSANAFVVPTKLAAGSVKDSLTIFLSTAGFGGILNVINDQGGSSTIANPDKVVPVVSYP